MKKVFIVHCIDTEGPMDETLKETFIRIKKISGIEIDPSINNLTKLQNKEIDLNGKESIVSNLVQPSRINMNRNWNDINKMLDKIQNSKFRNKLKDHNGNGWIYNWFCLDHVNMNGNNPGNRDIGHHKVLDFYTKN